MSPHCSAMALLKVIPILFVSPITDSMYAKFFLLKFGLKYLRGYISSILGAGWQELKL